MVYLAKGSGLLGFGQLVSMSAGFIMALLFANFLPKEVYGTYKFILSVTAILSITTLSGMGTAVTRAVARGFDGTLDEALRTKARWGLLGSVISILIAGYYSFSGDMALAFSFFIVALFMPTMEAYGVYDSFLQGKKEFGTSIRYAVISKILSIVAVGLTIALTDNVVFVLLAYFVPFTATRFLFLRRVRNKYKSNDTQEEGADSFGKHLSAMGILGTIAGQLDKLLVFHFLGAVELAAYAIITAPIDQIKGFTDNISKIALPKFSQQGAENIGHTIWRRMAILIVVLIAVTAAYWFISPLVFKIFFSHYTAYTHLSQLFGLSIVSFALFIPLQILQAQQETGRLYILNVLTSTIQIGLSIVLVISHGLVGVVVARVIARLVNAIIYMVILRTALQK
jgi:O-antigen/teichoic acid export membrane protein